MTDTPIAATEGGLREALLAEAKRIREHVPDERNSFAPVAIDVDDPAHAMVAGSLHADLLERAAAALATRTPSPCSLGTEVILEEAAAHLEARADGFVEAAKRQQKKVGPLNDGFREAAKAIRSLSAARPCPCLQPRPEQYPTDQFTEVSCRFGDSRHGVRTFVPRSDQKDQD